MKIKNEIVKLLKTQALCSVIIEFLFLLLILSGFIYFKREINNKDDLYYKNYQKKYVKQLGLLSKRALLASTKDSVNQTTITIEGLKQQKINLTSQIEFFTKSLNSFNEDKKKLEDEIIKKNNTLNSLIAENIKLKEELEKRKNSTNITVN